MNTLEQLQKLFTQGRISRREFMAKASMLGLAAAASPALLASPARAATPRKGGRLRMGVQGGHTSDSLDPATITNTMPQVMGYLFRNNLTEVNHKMQPVPELAESWEFSPDAAKWVFQLRKGIEFHNGKTMDAQDVVYSVNHHRGEDSKSAAKSLLENLVEVKADGKHTVVFTLKSGSADFPFLMSDYHITIFPDGTTDFDAGIGTGPFTKVAFEPGVRCFAKRNPNYWKPDRAHFDEVEVLMVPDVNARTTALKTGQVDVINRCDVKTYHLLKRLNGIQDIETKGMMHYTFAMLSDMAPHDNNDVRMALKHAIDREHLLKQILGGYGVVGNDHPISPVNRYHHGELAQHSYDPDKAKYYMKKAGLSGHTFDLHVSDEGFPGAVDAAVLYKEHAAKCGIDINVVREPADGYWSDVWIKKPWCAVYWGGRPTEDWMFTTAYAADAPWNDTRWKHDRFNELLVAARAELDDDKRRAMYHEMQDICSNQGSVMVLAFVSFLQAATDNLAFENMAANWEFDGFKGPERWWFKS